MQVLTLGLVAGLALTLAACSGGRPGEPDQERRKPQAPDNSGQEQVPEATTDPVETPPQGAMVAPGPQPLAAKIPDSLEIDAPPPGALVTSPLRLRGSLPGTWFFEGDFPLQLVSAEGVVVAEHYASAEGNWMTEEAVTFTSSIDFDVPEQTEVVLVLRPSNPSDQADTREARIPYVLMPSN